MTFSFTDFTQTNKKKIKCSISQPQKSDKYKKTYEIKRANMFHCLFGQQNTYGTKSYRIKDLLLGYTTTLTLILCRIRRDTRSNVKKKHDRARSRRRDTVKTCRVCVCVQYLA